MSDGPQAKNYVMQQVYDDATKSIRISGLSGGGGDSLWEYTTGTLQPDPASTTPLNDFNVIAAGTASTYAVAAFSDQIHVYVTDTATGVYRGDLIAEAASGVALAQMRATCADSNADFQILCVDGDSSTNAPFRFERSGVYIHLGLYPGDPNGIVSATKGSLLADYSTPALYQNTDASTAWSVVGGDQIRLAEAPADISWDGTAIYMTYGASLVPGDIVYFTSSGTVDKADANAAGKFPALGLALETASSGSHLVLLQGIFRHDSLYAWTVGGVLWLSTTAGALTQTQPSATDDCIQPMGFATHADRIFFRPDITWLTHV